MDRDLSSFSQWAGVTAGLGIGVVIGWLLRGKVHGVLARHLTDQSSKAVEHVMNDLCLSGDTKMVLVVRNDLKMGKGKACAQCAHAAVSYRV